ncbi:hypothetical protein [Sphingomonas fuzhouensis]|uniref:hypothetical protein n=1 Tax=Sphingomonas fuzhouensis TaxID=3106033 RepID=UPI002B0039F4|nr:hypothetical protein [Sphingomonas sp. SGZ-02]
MADIAFHGDPALKGHALAQLRRHIAADTFVYFPAWENGQANVIGAIIEADDTPGYAARLGYPIALAETLPVFVNGFRPRADAAAFAEAWLERTPVGADLTGVVSRLILSLLEQQTLCAVAERHPLLEQSRQAIVALHRRAIDGDEPDRKAWKSARLAAVAATDAIGDDPLGRKAGSAVEAAAWPGTMRTVLRDTLSAVGTLNLYRSLAEIGWTEEEESQVYKIREQAEKDGYKADLDGLARVYAILDADHPALGERFRMRCDRMDKSVATYMATGWKAIEVMEAAPLVVEA